ncbi:hypothetical protein NA57DRAFT_34726 [Rhizodiscina lignyota]|uniref:Signal recognition particle subunit SRP68 n=1 Tax=Rhizodiscina lignyota TaxID=1504668 RepID=A0A9P4IP51_9PEZI|nr:hypothetical protein NA57DRAFT_34726 [Rhizodiscina lignyota]
MDLTSFITSNRDRALQLGDYSTYRSQLSRQLLSLRKRLGRSTPKNSKYAPKAAITAADIGSNAEFARLLVMMAERAWAHAMHIKTQHTQVNPGKGLTGESRSHVLSRLDKAVKTAEILVEALGKREESKATDVDLLEAKAYASTLAGTEEFEKQANGSGPKGADQKERWKSCLERFAMAQVSYTALLRHSKNEVHKEVLSGTIDPSIRFASYQAFPKSRTLPIEAIARDYFPQEDTALLHLVKSVDPAALEDQTSEASKLDALASVTTAETRLSSFLVSNPDAVPREKATAYDDVIIASQDAADATRRAIDELEKEGVNEGDPRMQDLRVTSLAVNYDVVAWRVGRNRVLIGQNDGTDLNSEQPRPKKRRKGAAEQTMKEEATGRKLAKLRERVHLYEEVLQSLDSVKDLRGAVRDAAFIEELEGKRAYFQALKCLNIAYSHAIVSNPKNALALLLRAETIASNAVSASVKSPQPPADAPLKVDVSSNAAKQLHTRLKSLITQYRGLVELHNLNVNSNLAAQKNLTSAAPIVERLHEYPAAGVDLENLVTYPPKLKPVPVKPIFLDVAWNYIDYPGHGGAVQAPAPGEVNGMKEADGKEEQKPAKKGWFGFGR